MGCERSGGKFTVCKSDCWKFVKLEICKAGEFTVGQMTGWTNDRLDD